MGQTETFEAAPGLALAYDAYGPETGEPVIFAHGGGQTRHAWKGAAETLAVTDWRTIAYDHRGHGDSDWDADGDYAIERYGEDLIALADHIAPGRAAHVVGASLGGMAAIVAEGVIEPGKFASITLVDIVPGSRPEGVERILGFMAANAEEGFATLEEAADTIAEYLPHRPRPTNLDGLRKNLRHRDGRWYWHWDPRFLNGKTEDRSPRATGPGRAEHVERMEEAVRSIACPIHLVRGRSSELVDEKAVAHFRTLVPDFAYTDVAGARHMVAGDRNDVFIDAVSAFLEEHRSG